MSSTLTEAFNNASKKSPNMAKQLIVVKKYSDGKEKRNDKYMKRLIPLMDLAHYMFVEIDNDKPFFNMTKPYIRKVCKRATNKQYSDTEKAIRMVFVPSISGTQRESWQTVYDSLGMPIE